MTQKIYRTAQGKLVDIGALQLQNEDIRAVGNMGVNARGDVLDSANKPISSRNAQVAKQYNRQAVATTVPASSQRKQALRQAAPDIPAPPEDFQDDFVKEPESNAGPANATGGLAAAIAKARQIKQDPTVSNKPAKK